MHTQALKMKQLFGCCLVAFATLFASTNSSALPSYARQTGQECASCHVGSFGPQLTPYGQRFKIEGYVESNGESSVPISEMAVVTYASTKKDLPEGAGPYDKSNNNASLQELSLFGAGRITDHIGMFAQVTYSDVERKTSLDNVDIRFATQTKLFDKDATIGVSVNNNPTTQDAFNTTPGWRFPYTTSALAPTPAAAPLIDGGLEQQVIGASAYAFLDDRWFAELGLYRSLSTSFLDKVGLAAGARLDASAPYWRLAYRRDLKSRAFSIGAFGLSAKLDPNRSNGETNNYTDIGIDGNYQYLGNRSNVYTIDTSYIHEKQTNNYFYAENEASNRRGHLNQFNLAASWYLQKTYGLNARYFSTTGNGDEKLYAENPVDGSRVGSPNSRGFTWQVDYTPWGKEDSWNSPWANLRLGLQYTLYSKFNGASNDYDGDGRRARDNNTLYLFAWQAF